MQAYQEITDWKHPNHTYLLDGTNLVAYIKQGETTPFYFKNPIKGFDKRARKFKLVDAKLFNVKAADTMPWIKQVAGSKPGVNYTVNTEENTCTCPGYTFRGSCKHVKELETA